MGVKFNFNGRFVKEKQFRYSYGCRAIFSLLRRARTLALPIVVQLVSHLGGSFCEKSTKIGRMLQNGPVNHIRGKPQSIFTIEMLK